MSVQVLRVGTLQSLLFGVFVIVLASAKEASKSSVLPKGLTVDDGLAEESIKEMMGKLDGVLSQRKPCPSQAQPQAPAVTETPTPCYDVTSGRSVVTQICDKLSSLETRLAKVMTSRPTCPEVVLPTETRQTTSNEPPKPEKDESAGNSGSGDNSSDGEDAITLAQLKKELENLKRSSAFYARRQHQLPNNVTHQRLQGFRTTVNNGFNFFPTTGEFKAMYQGIYHFSLSFLKTDVFDLEAFLVVDNEVIATARDDQQAYIDLMTPLKPGQKVWADVTTTNVPEDSDVTLTFSGFLVN